MRASDVVNEASRNYDLAVTLDHQILLKSSSLNLLAGSNPDAVYSML